MPDYDLAIVGGGINGAAIARDAAGRGLRVILVEQNDLASGTSCASTKLIHGGLRYLEHGWFRLVREALAEREVLMRSAPNLIRPLRFVLPADSGMRSSWLLRLGLFIYDHLGGRTLLPPTTTVDLSRDPLGEPLTHRLQSGYEYSDCQTDDARLVVLNALDAAERGATIRTRTRCVRAERAEDWRLVFEARGRRDVATARVLINATGPWANIFGESVLAQKPARLRLDKGSHIVLRRLYDHDRAYLFQNHDGRVVFALPYEREFTLVGTTDVGFTGDPATVAPAPEEVAYLCDVVNTHLRASVTASDVVHAFAGVRALYDDGTSKPQDTPRDYVLALDQGEALAPLLTVYGGKLTTCRRLAEAALDRLAPAIRGSGGPWTAGAHLPGGDIAVDGVEDLVERTRQAWPFLTGTHARRLVHAYGTRVSRILGSATTAEAVGPWLGGDLTGAEVRYLMHNEWAQTEDDVLWRRSRLGLVFSRVQRAALAKLMTDTIGTDTVGVPDPIA
jgi:glycerol-3-phosphate dehydrogenase